MNEVAIKLFPSQLKALKATENVILLLCSRGYGKSYTAAYWAILKLLENNYRIILTNATFQQLRETTVYCLSHLETMGLRYEIHKRPSWCKSLLSDHKNILSVDVGDGKHHYIKLLSFDNIDSIRGSSCDALVLDEGALASENFFDTALLTLRGHPNGTLHDYQILIATTPTTVNNWIFKRFIQNEIPSFIEIKALAQENFIEYSKEKLELIKANMTELMYRREMLNEWISLTTNTMAYAFHDGLIKQLEGKEEGSLFMSCDINNIDLQTTVGWFSKDWIHQDGEILIHEGGNPIKVADQFHKLKSSLKQRQVTLFGDRYGSNKSTTSKTTYYEQLTKRLKELGWHVINKTLKANPSVWDSNEVFMKLCEKNQFTIDPSCDETIRHLKTCEWKENEHIMNKKLLDSGFYDGLRYIAYSQFRVGGKIVATNFF